MKAKIVADGYHRFQRAKKAASLEAMEKNYARQLTEADETQKPEIRRRMVEEYLRDKNTESHEPSAATLW